MDTYDSTNPPLGALSILRGATSSGSPPASNDTYNSTNPPLGALSILRGATTASANPPIPTPDTGGNGSSGHRHKRKRKSEGSDFKKFRYETKPAEVRKRLRNAFKKVVGDIATPASVSIALETLAPYVPGLNDLQPESLQHVADEIDWPVVARQISDEHGSKLIATAQAIEEEEYTLMLLLLNA